MFLSGRYSGSPQTLHGDRKQVKPMPFFVHSTSVACRSLHGYLFLLSYTVCGDLSIDADPTTLSFSTYRDGRPVFFRIISFIIRFLCDYYFVGLGGGGVLDPFGNSLCCV